MCLDYQDVGRGGILPGHPEEADSPGELQHTKKKKPNETFNLIQLSVSSSTPTASSPRAEL